MNGLELRSVVTSGGTQSPISIEPLNASAQAALHSGQRFCAASVCPILIAMLPSLWDTLLSLN